MKVTLPSIIYNLPDFVVVEYGEENNKAVIAYRHRFDIYSTYWSVFIGDNSEVVVPENLICVGDFIMNFKLNL